MSERVLLGRRLLLRADAEWVRVSAGVENAITAMAAGRFSVEGDVILASRLEAMFGAG